MPQFNSRPALVVLIAFGLGCGAAPLHAERRTEGPALYDGVPALSDEQRTAFAPFRATSESRLLGWLANGDLVVSTRFDEGEQLERLRAPATLQVAISHGGGTLRHLATQPFHSQLLAYLADDTQHGGAALYVQDADGGSERVLVNASALPGDAVFAHDGARLAYSATLPDSPFEAVFVADAGGTSVPRRLLRGEGERWRVLGWTRSDRAVLVERSAPAGIDGDELWLIDIDNGTQRRVDEPVEGAPARGRASERSRSGGRISQAHLANDDRGVYFLSDRDSDYTRLRYVDFFGAAPRDVSYAFGHDVEHFDLSADGRYLAYSWNDNGYSRMTIIERPLLERPQAAPLVREIRAPTLPVGVVHALQFAPQGTRLAIDLTGSAAVRDVYVHDLLDASSVRWTRSALGSASGKALVMAQTLRFPTWDRPDGRPRQLTAQLYRPGGDTRKAVLIILAGRGQQARAQLDMFVQFVVTQLHIAVIVPDLRGASGHGRSFAALASGASRSGESLDLGALLAWISSQPDLQRERIAVMGRGDGGELALTALGIYSDRLRAAISIDAIAGAAQLAAVRQPVLLLRGLSEPPLPASAAEQLLWRLRSNAVETWLMAPRDLEGRLGSSDAQLAAQQTMVQFLARFLNDEPPPAAGAAH